MTGRSILPTGALAVLVLLIHGQSFAQHTYRVNVRKTGTKYHADYAEQKPHPAFVVTEGAKITWEFTNTTQHTITIRAGDFLCNGITTTTPPTCPLDFPNCGKEVTLMPQQAGPISGVARDSGCATIHPRKRFHKFNFVVASGPDTPQNIDPRLDIDREGLHIFPVLVLLAAAVVVVAAAVALYKKFSAGGRTRS